MDGKSQAAVLRGPATPTLAAANASRVLASAPRTDFLLECTGFKLPTVARSSYLNRRLCARRHRSQRLAQGAEAVGFAHEAEQAGQRLSCAQHPCFCSRLTALALLLSITTCTIPRLTRGRCCAANNTFRGLRSFVGTQDLAFVQYTTSEDWMYERPYHEELYDMTSDHYQSVPLTLRLDLSAWPVLGSAMFESGC